MFGISSVLEASSGKGRKAERLISEGRIAEAMEEYQKMVEKYRDKEPEYVQEAHNGLARCWLIKAKDAYRDKNFIEAKSSAEEVVSRYKDTSSVEEANTYLVLAQYELSRSLLAERKYQECISQCKEVLKKIPGTTHGVDKLKRVIGDSLYFLGKEALEDKDYSGAIEKLEAVRNEYPESEKVNEAVVDLAEAMFQQGLIHTEKEEYREALTLFENVLEMSGENKAITHKVKQGMAQVLLAMAEKDFNQKEYASAIQKCQKGIEQLPKEAPILPGLRELMGKAGEALFRRAEERMKKREYKEAIKDLELAFTSTREKEFRARCQYLIGKCNRLNGEHEGALSTYQAVLNRFKDTLVVPVTYYDMYLIYSGQNRKEKALNSIKLASAADPGNSEYLFSLAELLSALGQAEEAKSAYEKVLPILQEEVNKTFLHKEKVQYRLGQAYLNLGQYTEAAIEFDKALHREPSMMEARKGLAEAQFQDQNYTGAIKTYAYLIKEEADNFKDLESRLAKEKSLQLAQELETARKELAFFHFQTGLSYEQLGDYDKALQECRLGLEGVPTQKAAAALKRIQSRLQDKKDSGTKKEDGKEE